MADAGSYDVSRGCSFGFEFDHTQVNHIMEVGGIKIEHDVIELKHNTPDGKYVNTFLPGRPKPGELTVKRGLTDDTTFHEWIKVSKEGKMSDARRNGSVTVYTAEGKPFQRYEFTNCLAHKIDVDRMTSGDTNSLTETLTLTYDACAMVPAT